MTETTLLNFLLQDAPERAVFLRGQNHPAVHTGNWWIYQPFKPLADILEAAGAPCATSLTDMPATTSVYLMGSRQKEENRTLLAHAAEALNDGGRLTALLPNDLGAKSLEADIKALFGEALSTSKHHARRITAVKTPLLNGTLQAEWLALNTPKENGANRYITAPGMFSWRKVDSGSALLMRTLPSTLRGHMADLGAGWGYLSAEALKKAPEITGIDLFEAENLALECARLNLTSATCPITFTWADVATMPAKRAYDVVVSNPPVHDLHESDIALGQRFVEQALAMAKPHGRIYIVANRKLPYEALLTKSCKKVEVLADESGYKVLEARR